MPGDSRWQFWIECAELPQLEAGTTVEGLPEAVEAAAVWLREQGAEGEVRHAIISAQEGEALAGEREE